MATNPALDASPLTDRRDGCPGASIWSRISPAIFHLSLVDKCAHDEKKEGRVVGEEKLHPPLTLGGRGSTANGGRVQ